MRLSEFGSAHECGSALVRIGQQPAGADQLHPLRASPLDQILRERLIHSATAAFLLRAAV